VTERVTKTLAQCCEIISGATPQTSVAEYWGGDICWATPKDLSDLDGHFIASTPRKITKAGLISCAASVLPANSVLFSSRAPIGHVAVNTTPMATNQGFKSFIPKQDLLEPKFLFHWLRANRAHLESLGNGATFKEVSKAVVARVEIALPPLPEQRRIAAILDQADALRAKRREALAQLDSLTQSIFIEMFGDSRNPKGWSLQSLPAATDFQEGPGIMAKDFHEGGVPLVRLAGFGSGEVSLRGCNFVAPELFARKWAHFALRKGDILVLTSATFGNPAVVGKEAAGAIFYTGIIRFKPRHSDLDPAYLRHFLASPWFMRQATALASGAVIKHFGPTHLKQMTIPMPPLLLQQQFANRAAEVECLRVPVAQAVAVTEQLFASLQHRAFAGQLS
jgi:type I restriction enzyme S subunit